MSSSWAGRYAFAKCALCKWEGENGRGNLRRCGVGQEGCSYAGHDNWGEAVTLPALGDPKLWLAILHELLEAGGAARPEFIYPKIRRYFGDVSDAEVAQTYRNSGINIWTNGINGRAHVWWTMA